MPALLENGHVYIAQPPLYRAKKKKVAKYIHTEAEMDEYLLTLGTSDVSLEIHSSGAFLLPDELVELTKAIIATEKLADTIQRKGMFFNAFLSMKKEDGSYPKYSVQLKDTTHFVYSDDEFADLKEKDYQEQLQLYTELQESVPDEEKTPSITEFKPVSLKYTELYNETIFTEIESALNKFGFTLSCFTNGKEKSLCFTQADEVVSECKTLKEALDFIRENGKKGVELQRYKGLGEMNADQLWDTTMDPKERTLLKVEIPDAVAADKMFTVLMGEEVKPRRNFIQSHALYVQNLDI